LAVTEQRLKTHPIEAQSTPYIGTWRPFATPVAVYFGAVNEHEQRSFSLSVGDTSGFGVAVDRARMFGAVPPAGWDSLNAHDEEAQHPYPPTLDPCARKIRH